MGIERTVLPLMAEADFGVASTVAATAFIVTFGLTKALMNLAAGSLADRHGRRPLLLLGWLYAIPVPLILMWAPSWAWVLLANVLLGMNQALTWSMTVVMKVDLAPRSLWGRVIGWNEFAGYAGMSATAAGTGVIASTYGLRPEPYYLGLGVAVAGLLLAIGVRETRPVPRARQGWTPVPRPPRLRTALGQGTYAHPGLSSASLCGLATNFKDGALWGLLPLLLATRALSLGGIGFVVALYPAIWAVTQLYFGPLSDRIGRRVLIVAGMGVQACGVSLFAWGGSWASAVAGATFSGLGTGMVYPTLLAFVSEQTDARGRASALGVYRLWRDSGYAFGALTAGVLADLLGIRAALVGVTAVLLLASVTFRQRVDAA